MWLISSSNKAKESVTLLLDKRYSGWLVYGQHNVSYLAKLGGCFAVKDVRGIVVDGGLVLSVIAKNICQWLTDENTLVIYDEPWLAAMCAELSNRPIQQITSVQQEFSLGESMLANNHCNYSELVIVSSDTDCWQTECFMVDLP